MLGLLVLGMGFLGMKQQRLMFVSLICCASLALFLKSTTTSKLKAATKEAKPEFTFANVNLTDITLDVDTAFNALMEVDADIITVLEVTPLWEEKLNEFFGEKYPHSKMDVRIDPFGIGVFSKEPFNLIDTFQFDGIPNIIGSFDKNGMQETYFIISHLFPPLSNSKIQQMNDHLETITSYVNKINGPVLSIGEFNSVAWSNEIQTFKSNTGLKDSRRGGMPPLPGKSFALLNAPLDYIFHSDHLKCLSFEPITDNLTGQLGIFGTYQFSAESYEEGS